MSKILSIGTAVPAFAHAQADILPFMQDIYALNEAGRRRLQYLYHQSGIETRYSVIPDYTRPASEWKFYPPSENLEPFPSLEQRMVWYNRHAAPLSLDAIRQCLGSKYAAKDITHLITVSCTGMTAPGLDLEIAALLELPPTVFRTSVNFMGCYAAIHALKLADALCRASESPGRNAGAHAHTNAAAGTHASPDTGRQPRILIVCTELCTLHFQRSASVDNITSSLLFGDGSAAALVVPDHHPGKGWILENFYSEILPKGKKDMSWELSSTGFQMGLSTYVPDLIKSDFAGFLDRAAHSSGLERQQLGHYCIHPGGRKILEAAAHSLDLQPADLAASYDILREYGNMSSATLLFVLQRMTHRLPAIPREYVFGAAFGPGLTMESMIMRPAA